jgi:DNA invertase Pin-like site-specific DNA recombinase
MIWSEAAKEIERRAAEGDGKLTEEVDERSLEYILSDIRKNRYGQRRAKRTDRREVVMPINLRRRNGPPMVFGYGRVSTQGQYEKDNSVPAQQMRIEHYYNMVLKETGADWGGFRDDGQGISARKSTFAARPGGAKLLAELCAGDHLIVDKVDRLFRNIRDFVDMTEWFDRHEINLHILNLGGMSFNATSPMGKMMLSMLAVFAEMESRVTGDRTKEAIGVKKKNGTYKVPPIACKRVRYGTKYRYEWDLEQRKYLAAIVELRDNHYFTYKEIALELAERRKSMTKEELSHPLIKVYKDMDTQVAHLHEMYTYGKAFEVLGINDPLKVPSKAVMEEVARRARHEMKDFWGEERKRLKMGRKSLRDPLPSRAR